MILRACLTCFETDPECGVEYEFSLDGSDLASKLPFVKIRLYFDAGGVKSLYVHFLMIFFKNSWLGSIVCI